MDKRKLLSKLYIVLLTCLLILPCSKDVNGADWTWFGEGEHSLLLFFYDSESINFLPNNIIRVWVKIIPESEEDRVRYIQDMRNANQTIPDNWRFSIGLFEINCKNKTYTSIESKTYSIKNELIKSDTAKYPYKHITPETIMETLSKIVCVKKGLKKGSWTFVGQAENNNSWYYDAESINLLPNNVIRVWVKKIPYAAVAHQYSYRLALWEVNCKDNTLNILALKEYNAKDEVTSSGKNTKPDPVYIVSDSIGAEFHKTICSLKNLKKKRR